MDSDAELASLVAGGDHEAFAKLVKKSAPVTHAVLRRMGASESVAADFTQEAFVVAFRRVRTFRGDASFAAWVTTIAARLYLRHARNNARLVFVGEPIEPEAHDDGQTTEIARLDLDRALQRLSPPERLCVSLCHGVGMSHPEIATETGLPLGTVKSHVTRGLKKLRVLMGEHESEMRSEKE